MNVLAFLPLSLAVVAGAAGGITGLAQSDDAAPWTTNRSALVADDAASTFVLTSLLACDEVVSGIIDYVDGSTPDSRDPVAQAAEAAADQVGESGATAKSWTYDGSSGLTV